MTFDYERIVPREKTTIFSDRMAASSRTLFQIIREFFEPNFLIHQIEFGENLCWIGFRTAQTGNEDLGWVRIASGLGVKAPGERLYRLLDLPPVQVGSVSIRSLSPIASRVLIRTDYTPEALSNLFNGLVQYLIWVVNGEDARAAWSRAVSGAQIKVVPQVDAGEIPLLEAPSAATLQIRDGDRPSISQTTVQQSKPKLHRRKSRKRSRTDKTSKGRHAKKKIYVPKGPVAFERYCKMWQIICQTQRAYLHPQNDIEERRPNPTIDELRDAIEEKVRKKYSEKTVRRVIQAGSAGLLKKR